ncbi:MAG: hypothetical protein C0403_11550 [Desulfobacterium sp.]|nr:hypothetical protein [Desulfobacterium sp.]
MISSISSNHIIIAPIGSFIKDSILKQLVEFIYDRCGLDCRIEAKVEIPDYCHNKIRGQYDSKEILKYLISHSHPKSLKFIGITELDLFVPILKYVFGLSQINGTFSIISLHRLYPGFYNDPPNPNLFFSRMQKTTLHELGHAFGLTHCREKKCVMYSSIRIADTDIKESSFCSTCFELFKWHRENTK